MPEYTTGRATPIENRNFLAPTGFKFTLERAKSVSFFCNQANVPDITLGIAEQPSWLKNIDVPGDKIQFGDLNLQFLVDEDLKNYMAIQKWIRGLGYPESMKEFRDLESEATMPANFGQVGDNIYSDGTLQILSSNYRPSIHVNFKDAFPVSLSTLDFDVTTRDYSFFTASVTFKYTIYNITDPSGNRLDNFPKK